MNLRRGLWFAGLSFLTATGVMSQTDGRNLPVVRILGESYYYYEAGRNESSYAIAKEMGWDPVVLSEMNPNLSSPIEKGTVIYYPVAARSADSYGRKSDSTSNLSGSSGCAISHTVERGETVYSIARRYNVTTDAIYAMNPDSQYGVKAGDVLVIDPGSSLSHTEGGYLYHTVKSGETLYSVAHRYNTGVDDLMRINPGLSESNFKAGMTVRIVPDTDSKATGRAERRRVVSVTNYRVGRKDTWMSISRATGVAPELLKEANPEVGVLEKGMVLAVPRTEVVPEAQMDVKEDSSGSTSDSQEDLSESLNGFPVTGDLPEVRVSVLIEDIASNKDMEFARGFLLAVDKLKKEPYHISVGIIDGSVTCDSIIAELSSFNPNLIVTTHEKNYPVCVAEYAQDRGVKALNVFDVKNESYVTNSEMVQLLTPSEYFNGSVARYLADRFEGYTLVVAGDESADDGILSALRAAMNYSGERVVPVSALADMDLSENEDILVYGTALKKNEIGSLLDKVVSLRQKAPESEIALVGRPNWIAYADAFSDKYSEAVAYIPSRFYFDPDLSACREMIEDYRKMYGHTPVKSFPVYAVAGYDVAGHFIPGIAASGGDFNEPLPHTATLQTDFELVRSGDSRGFYNPVVYLVKFNEFGNIDKIAVK